VQSVTAAAAAAASRRRGRSGSSSAGRMHAVPLSVPEVLRIAIDVASAMQYLHNMQPQVVHRDLKPQNVLLDLQGRAKVRHSIRLQARGCLHCHPAASTHMLYTMSIALHQCCTAVRLCWLRFCNKTSSHSAALRAANALRHQQPTSPSSAQHSSTMPSLQLHNYLPLRVNQLYGMHAHSHQTPADVPASPVHTCMHPTALCRCATLASAR
jgi:hypothetical protein